LSWTIVPATTDVTTPPVALRMSVRAVSSPQFFEALPLPPDAVFTAVPVVRVSVSPPTGTFDVADTTVVPVVADVIVTVQLADAEPPVYVHDGEPTNEPGPDTMEAVAVFGPAPIVPPNAFTVIVSTWFVETGLLSVGGAIWTFASTHVLEALPLPPDAVLTAVPVVRAIVTPFTGMSDVADTTVVPTLAELIVTVQLADAEPPVYVHVGEPTKLPGPLTIDAVVVCGPASIVSPSALTVIVST